MNTTYELLRWAGHGLVPIPLPSDYSPPRADLVPIAEHLEAVEERSELENALQYMVVSPETAALCAEEMYESERRGWRL